MKLAYCKFCNDYTLGTQNTHTETVTQVKYWHVCGNCGVSTDSFMQKPKKQASMDKKAA